MNKQLGKGIATFGIAMAAGVQVWASHGIIEPW